MAEALRFHEGERAKVDAIVDGFREHLKQDGQWEVSTGFPFAHHHRWARNELRRYSRQKYLPATDVARLLLDWARHCGDVRLYAVQPFAQWARHCLDKGIQPHQSLQQAIMIVDGTKVPFIDFAQARLIEGDMARANLQPTA